MSAIYYSESFLITYLCLVLSLAKTRSLSPVPLFIPWLVSSLLHTTENRCYLGYITSQSTHILSHVIFFDLLGSLLPPAPLPRCFSSQRPSPQPLAPSVHSFVLRSLYQRTEADQPLQCSFEIQVICHRTGCKCINGGALNWSFRACYQSKSPLTISKWFIE